MERLTERSLDYCTQLCSSDDAICCSYYKGEQEEKCWLANMYDRLAAYEDTGLEPEQVKAFVSTADNIVKLDVNKLYPDAEITMYGEPLSHWQELSKAEQEGCLVVLPCKVGDTVWFNTYKNNATECVGIQPHEVKRVNVYFLTDGAEIPEWEFGKTVFLTSAEAEKAMEVIEDA